MNDDQFGDESAHEPRRREHGDADDEPGRDPAGGGAPEDGGGAPDAPDEGAFRDDPHDDSHGGPDDDPHAGVIGAHPVDDEASRRRRRRIVWSVAAVFLVLLLVVAWVGLRPLAQQVFGSKDFDGPGEGQVTVVVKPGESVREIGTTLEQAGVVKSEGAFADAVEEHKGADVQPGQYTLKSQMTAEDALAMLRGGGRDTVRATVREGLWKSEVFQTLSQATGTSIADYQAVEKQAQQDPNVLGLPSSAKGNLEGYLFPATYTFDPGTSARDQLRQLVAHSTTQLRGLGVDDAHMERVVIVASLVEAEARLDADRPKVARVIENRLAKGMPLQFDSTVMYGVQRREKVTTTDQERAAQNGYNTYVNKGLPAGPIGNPGAGAITAAQKPAAGSWLYFVTVDPSTGRTLFATTDAEHQQNVATFQKWCQAHPGQC